MKSAFPIPEAALQQHTAVLGKTGAGKTYTTKLMIEHVVEQGARVCILDPIKSDHWGLTVSADGKKAGLPFNILGGPHGHLPLSASSGKAIAELVASGALPLAVLDMADFPPGGQNRFFADFAPVLLRKMKGVLYLVLEEAHMFAPKERSGLSDENLSIHWAKMLATAGRSKGIRLIPATQRVQSLHNAVLGSCETLITHRLTAPADQEPVLKWLKANTDKETAANIAASMSQLTTGTGWLCSGEAQVFEKVNFPAISTYDNSATPTSNAAKQDVKVNAVDIEKLRAIVGAAVQEAEAEDPRALKQQLQQLKGKMAEQDRQLSKVGKLFTQAQVNKLIVDAITEDRNDRGQPVADPVELRALQAGMEKIYAIAGKFCAMTVTGDNSVKPSIRQPTAVLSTKAPMVKQFVSSDAGLSKTARRIINAIHRSAPQAITFEAAAARAAVSKRSSAYSAYRKQVLASTEITTRHDGKLMSAPGFAAEIGPGVNPIEEYERKLSPSYGRMLRAIADNGPLEKLEVAGHAGVSPTSSGLTAGLNELIALGLVVCESDLYNIHPDLREAP